MTLQEKQMFDDFISFLKSKYDTKKEEIMDVLGQTVCTTDIADKSTPAVAYRVMISKLDPL